MQQWPTAQSSRALGFTVWGRWVQHITPRQVFLALKVTHNLIGVSWKDPPWVEEAAKAFQPKIEHPPLSLESKTSLRILFSWARLQRQSTMTTGTKLYYISAAVGIIDTAAVLLRFMARQKSNAKFGADDVFIACSLLPLYGMIVSSVLRASNPSSKFLIASLTRHSCCQSLLKEGLEGLWQH